MRDVIRIAIVFLLTSLTAFSRCLDLLSDIGRLVERLLRAACCCVSSTVGEMSIVLVNRLLGFHPQLLHLNHCHRLVILLWIADVALMHTI